MTTAEEDAMDKEMEQEARVRVQHKRILQPIDFSVYENINDLMKVKEYLEGKVQYYQLELVKVNNAILNVKPI